MTARRLSFVAPGEVTVETGPAPDPGRGELLVETAYSAISSGTERLVYRGEAPADLAADETIDALSGSLEFPLSYGYAAAGTVVAVGDEVPEEWLERRVFAYNPHESHFLASPDDVLEIPPDVSLREATLLATVETALTFVLDGEPVIGERVAVFGQGVVGLLTSALLARSPLEALVAVEDLPRRRDLAADLGADRALPPADAPAAFREATGERADLVYELSGCPSALDDAVETAGFGGRVVVGSWYGTNPVTLDLGGRFHRERIRLVSSQVSTIAPRHRGRFSRDRRHDLAWTWLSRLTLEDLFTHELPLEDAQTAYRTLEERPNEAVQVVFDYG
ncbi:zinc-dependent alcohol dehydrogenase [Natronobiforma cellulositropha]|uniref:zinc-dependent alcohol dehydrogenase n=1 Tax=Natronobiforma cellulositropha TaxID=1679076 RepID=UPI0021D5B199|nr:zinc-binding alcohol dehydrogenase [Natronobiforma cellulositropha]